MFRVNPLVEVFGDRRIEAEAVFCGKPFAPFTPNRPSFDDDWLRNRSASEKEAVRSAFPDCDLLLGKREVVVLSSARVAVYMASPDNLIDEREATTRLREDNISGTE
jgi:hypothetical protein